MTHDSMNIAVIGCGSIAQHAHLPAIQRTPRSNLVAVYDFYEDVARKVARLNGLDEKDGYGDHAPILEREDVDAVAICAPTTKHAEITMAALRAGKHVLVEKPMAVTADEARDMQRVAEETGRTLMIAYNHSYDPAVAYVRDLIANDELGEILYAEVFFYEDLYSWTAGALRSTVRSENQKSFWPKYDNRFENLREYIHNFDSHVLNLMRLLIGDPKGIDYCHWVEGSGLWGLFDYGAFKTGFKNVQLKQLRFEKGIELCGRKKRVKIELAPPLERYMPGVVEIVDMEAKTTYRPFLNLLWPFDMEHEHFAECVLEGKEPLTCGKQALMDVVLTEDLARIALG